MATALGYANTKDALARHCRGSLITTPLKRLVASSRSGLPAKVSYYDVVLASPSLITTTEIAKDYGLSAKKLNQILRGEQVQFHQPGRWFLYAKFTEKGYTQSKTYEYDEGKTCTHMYWTQKGRLFIYDLLKNIRGLLPVVEREGEDAR